MVRLNVLICGIGGQGVVTTGKILAEAFHKKGIKVMEAETHGLAQRGGAVSVHVRVGDVEVPLIPKGEADYVIALEATEALRNVSFFSPKTIILLNKMVKPPALPKQAPIELEYIISHLKPWRTFTVDCGEVIQEGRSRCNIVMLAHLFHVGLKEFLEPDDIMSAIPGAVNRNLFVKYLDSLQNRVLSGPAGI